MKKTALLTITDLFPFVVFSQPLDLLNNFLNEDKTGFPVLLSNKPFKKTENLQKNYRKERSRFLGPENLFGLIPARILRRWFATAAESIFGMRI